MRTMIANELGFEEVSNLGKYLGVSLLHDRVTTATYRYIIEKVEQCFSGWVAKTLSLAGCITVVKSVLQTISYYEMQSRTLEKHIQRFVWNASGGSNSLTLNKWDVVKQPVEEELLVNHCLYNHMPQPIPVTLMITASGNWDSEKLRGIVLDQVCQKIDVIIPPNPFLGVDKPRWRWEVNNKFIVKSAYNSLATPMHNDESVVWKKLWAIHDVLFHAWNLGTRRIEVETDSAMAVNKVVDKLASMANGKPVRVMLYQEVPYDVATLVAEDHGSMS
ncbi:hypothetical protein F3Y22_tig00110053pilonHSYRG00038 [Hibiscus syriacus]|uniref:RNase H type-1 domain-containing protein n=1 Tax=Hibiscus syriacus TaxID=106335 RepID=A0A6A3BQY2_HIBSY|nr:hypothetical protein F3Y22_tig00110053pilonHSYRG00038 [Hibiscus syriacus]